MSETVTTKKRKRVVIYISPETHFELMRHRLLDDKSMGRIIEDLMAKKAKRTKSA